MGNVAEFTAEQQSSISAKRARMLGVAVCAFLLSLLTVFVQVKHLGLSWHETEYRAQLEQIAAGDATAPEVHRPLSAWIAIGTTRLFESVGVPRGGGIALIAIRLGQNLVLFLLALAVYRRLGIPPYLGLLGLSVVAWGMTQSHDSAGLALDIYTETILYLFAAWVVIAQNPWWVVPMAALAAINRETSVLIPGILLGVSARTGILPVNRSAGILPAISSTAAPTVRGQDARAPVKWLFLIFCGALLSWGLSRALVSAVQGTSDTPSEHNWALCWACLASCQHLDFWTSLVGIFSIVPVVALLGCRTWPPVLRCWFWLLGPGWLTLYVILDPTGMHHVWMLPQVFVLVPGLLLFIVSVRGTNQAGETT